MHRVSLFFRRSITLSLTVLLMSTVATVYGAEDKASRFYEDALARFERKDVAGAIIQLKNALNEDPKMLAGQILIGRAYLAAGQPADAQAALEKAQSYGADFSEIALPLAKALLDQGQAAQLLQRFPPASLAGDRRSDLLVLRGEAQRQVGDWAAAARSFEEARAINPKSVAAILATADLLLLRGNAREAHEFVNLALSVSPENGNAWYLKGLILQGMGETGGALDSYAKALGFQPKHVDARVARASLLLDLNRTSDLASDLDFFRRELPMEPRGNYIRAVYLGRNGDAAGTQKALMDVSQALDPIPVESLRSLAPELLLLGGLAHHGLGNLQKARYYLEQYVRLRPAHVGARKVLGSVLLDRQDVVAAISVLEPGLRSAPNDPQLLALLASANMMRRQNSQAIRYMEQALATGETTPSMEATLGFSLLRSGQQQAGVQRLQTAFDKDASLENAGAALTIHYIEKGRVKEAVQIAERLVNRYPENVAALNLIGITRAAAGDMKGARAAYVKAIKLDANFTPARLNLGKLELKEGKTDAARDSFLAILKVQPKNVQALYELARLEDAAGNRSEAIRLLEKLRAIDQRNVAGALYLAETYLRTKDPQKAVETIRGIEPHAADNLDVLATAGRVLLANQDEKGAQAYFAKMTRLAEFDPAAQLRIARLQLAANNVEGAAYSVDKALAGKPEHLPALALQVEIEIRRGQLDKAESKARELVARFPTEAVGYRVSGDVSLARKRTTDAINSYKEALFRESSAENLMRLYSCYMLIGASNKAIELVQSWVREHPKDATSKRALAEAYLRAGDTKSARSTYEALLREEGESASVLNNLAIVLFGQADPAALDVARRAHKLAPGDSSIQDTLGWLMVQAGEVDAGLRHLRDARLRDPRNPNIRYHLAAALAQQGRKDEARKELSGVLSEFPQFESAAEAQMLARRLAEN